MEDQITQTPTTPIVEVMPTAPSAPDVNTPVIPPQKTSYHHKRKWGWIIIVVILLIIIAVAAWFYLRPTPRPAPLSPAQTLQALETSSQPVTTTPAERGTAVNTLNQHSPASVSTDQDQLQMLNALNK